MAIDWENGCINGKQFRLASELIDDTPRVGDLAAGEAGYIYGDALKADKRGVLWIHPQEDLIHPKIVRTSDPRENFCRVIRNLTGQVDELIVDGTRSRFAHPNEPEHRIRRDRSTDFRSGSWLRVTELVLDPRRAEMLAFIVKMAFNSDLGESEIPSGLEIGPED